MKRSKWPLLSALTVLVMVMTGYVLIRSADPGIPDSEADIRKLGLGTASTVVIALTSDCASCAESMDAYKRLMALRVMDGHDRRLIVVSMDGVGPVSDFIGRYGFNPHKLTSGPYKFKEIAGVSEPGTILVLDADGTVRGKWVGRVTALKEEEIIKALGT